MMEDEGELVYAEEEEQEPEEVIQDEDGTYLVQSSVDHRGEEYVITTSSHPGINVLSTNGLDNSVGSTTSRRSVNGGQRPVHQCSQCDKMFMSFKGLQQHAVIHTDLKPFVCELCNKAFRFKSNLFEHKSMHSGATPHTCPFCQKTCRLKGNLKKHLKTHIQDTDELERVWRPYASNRRPPQDIPENAIVVRSSGEMYYSTPPSRPKKKKLGLGEDSESWVNRIKSGDLCPSATIPDKLGRLSELLQCAEQSMYTVNELFEVLRSAPFEHYACPYCKDTAFYTRSECDQHLQSMHSSHNMNLFCQICIRSFTDAKSLQQHQQHHSKVNSMISDQAIQLKDPELQDPDEFFIYAQTLEDAIVETEEADQNMACD